MKSKLANFRTRKKITELVLFSDEEAISWLKGHTPSPSTIGNASEEFDGDEDWRIVVEYSWYRRDNEALRLALAQYGCTPVVLKRLKRRKKYLKTLLSNTMAFPEEIGIISGFSNLFSEQEIKSLYENWIERKEQFNTFFSNPYISQYIINLFLEDRKTLFNPKNEDRSTFFFALISENPAFYKTLDFRQTLDMRVNYEFENFVSSVFNIIYEAPTTESWATAINHFLSKNQFIYPHSLIDIDAFFKKWADKPKDKKPKFGETSKYYLRYEFCRFCIKNVRWIKLPFTGLEEEKEKLEVIVQYLDPVYWIGEYIDDNDFEPPVIDLEKGYRHYFNSSKQQDENTVAARNTIKRIFDKGIGLSSLIHNEAFYKNENRREFLERIVDAYDESVTEWEYLRIKERELAEKHPEYFEEKNNDAEHKEDYKKAVEKELREYLNETSPKSFTKLNFFFPPSYHNIHIHEGGTCLGSTDIGHKSDLVFRLYWAGDKERYLFDDNRLEDFKSQFLSELIHKKDSSILDVQISSVDLQIFKKENKNIASFELDYSASMENSKASQNEELKTFTISDENNSIEVNSAIITLRLRLPENLFKQLFRMCQERLNTPSLYLGIILRVLSYNNSKDTKFYKHYKAHIYHNSISDKKNYYIIFATDLLTTHFYTDSGRWGSSSFETNKDVELLELVRKNNHQIEKVENSLAEVARNSGISNTTINKQILIIHDEIITFRKYARWSFTIIILIIIYFIYTLYL